MSFNLGRKVEVKRREELSSEEMQKEIAEFMSRAAPMTDDFPLCRQAGLAVWSRSPLRNDPISTVETIYPTITAADVEQLLANAPVVYGAGGPFGTGGTPWSEDRTKNEARIDWTTHSARLIMIEPLRKDSAESLLREWIELFGHNDFYPDKKGNDLLERARKVLGE